MAKQVVDRMVEREGREAPCRTGDLPLGMPAGDQDLAAPGGLDGSLPDGHRELLAFRYGHAARDVLRVAADRPELARPIVDGIPDLLAEAVIAARREQARTIGDVLLRRTRLGLIAAPRLRTAESVTPVAEAMAGELGWDRARTEAEAERWVAEAAAEGIDPALSSSTAR
jgi:glycerol-3-phosphate dehydrogenase